MTDKNLQNGFDAHNLNHISVSQVNKFREASDAWAVQYLFKQKFPFGPAALQGKAVETGVDHGIYNDADDAECVNLAWSYFNNEAMSIASSADEFEKRKNTIAQMVCVALEQMRPLGKPELPPEGSAQHQISLNVRFAEGEQGTIPLLGFLDYYYPQHDLVVDLKTTAKAPSSWSTSHGIQAAVYEKAVSKLTSKKNKVKFLYCLSRKKDPHVWLEMDDSDFYMALFKQTVRTMNHVLAISNTKEEVLKLLVHNPDSFYWNDAQEIAQAFYPS